MDYMFADFGGDCLSRFPVRPRTNRQRDSAPYLRRWLYSGHG